MSTINGCISLAILIWSCGNVFSQDFRYHHYTIEDGLPSSKVFNLVQDDDGYMWFATPVGACRFDGNKFKTFTIKDGLPDNDIINILKLRDGSIWFISFNGKASYFKNDSIFQFNPDGLLDAFGVRYVHLDSKDNLWFGSWDKGIIKYNSGKHQIINTKDGLPNNWAYAVEDERGITRINSGKTYGTLKDSVFHSCYSLPDDLFRPSQAQTLSIYSLGDNKIIGTAGKHVVIMGDSSFSVVYPVKDEEDPPSLYYLSEDSKDNILVGSRNGGIRLDPFNPPYESEIYLKGHDVSAFLEDQEGNLWLTTLNDGIYFLSNKAKQITNYDENKIHPSDITSILKSENGELFLGHPDGIIQIMGHEYNVTLDLNFQNSTNVIHHFYSEDQAVWCASDQGLFVLPKKNFNSFKIHPFEIKSGNLSALKNSGIEISKQFNCIVPGAKSIVGGRNDIWFAVWDHLYQITEEKDNYLLKIIDSVRVTALCFDSIRNRLWIGRINGLDYFKDDSIVHFNEQVELANVPILDLQLDSQGTLWIATNGFGIYASNDSLLLNISTEHGILSDKINDLYVAGNNIWLATPNGISKIDFNLEKLNYRILNITSNDGLLSNEINSVVVSDDTVYVGTGSGLSLFDSKTLTTNSVSPPVYLTSFSIQDKDTTLLNNYDLNHSQNNLSIKYSGISYSSGTLLKYSYKLEGVDQEWRKTDISEVNYPAMQPGRYSFLVKAINSDGIQSEKAASIQFIIRPPFWRTVWFYAVVSVGLFVIILVSVFLWMRRVRRQEQEKNDISRRIIELRLKALQAQMNPHFMSNALTSIQHFIINHDTSAANFFLAKFARLTRLVLELSRKDWIPLSEEIEMLTLYLELEALRFDGKIQYRISVDENINPDEVELPALIVQPFVENAILHGLEPKNGNGRVEVAFTLSDGALKCVVTDDGVGRAEDKFESKTLRQSIGMSIIDEKLQLMNLSKKEIMTVKVSDLNNSTEKKYGTKVEILVPIGINFKT